MGPSALVVISAAAPALLPVCLPAQNLCSIAHQAPDKTGVWRPFEDHLPAHRGIAGADAKAAEQYRAHAMKADGEVDEESKTNESGRLAEAGTYASLSKQTIQALESELASLSPADLVAPAYYDADSKRPSRFTDPSSPGAQRTVEPNPKFFEPRGALGTQPIVVWGLRHGLGELERNIRANVGWRVPLSCADEANPSFLARACARVPADLNWQRLASLLN